MVILPVPMIDEIKSLPETKVSAARELFRRAAGKYSKMGTNTIAAIRTLRIDFSRSGTTISALREEEDFAFTQTFGNSDYDDWTPVPVYASANQIIAMVSGRIFLGKQLCRTEEWISLTVEWSRDVFALLTKTAKYPTWLRPWVVPHFSETRRVINLRARAKSFLSPAFSEQIEAKENGAPPSARMQDTLVSWMIKYVTPRHMNVESLVRHQLGITWAAIHTTTHALTNILFDLATWPEYQDGLRKELESVLENCDEILTQQDLLRLEKMDSFMKESQRFNPATLVAPMRLAVDSLTLSTGQTIPAETPFGFASMSINKSNSIYKSPPADAFDGYRYARERERAANENQHQFGSTGPGETLDFGHGIPACPVRSVSH
jgi:cytochrome P450